MSGPVKAPVNVVVRAGDWFLSCTAGKPESWTGALGMILAMVNALVPGGNLVVKGPTIYHAAAIVLPLAVAVLPLRGCCVEPYEYRRHGVI